MTQENKELLLKDLCARIPYGVKMNHICEMGHNPETLIGVAKDMITLQSSAGYSTDDVENYRPYLFPLFSMTKEQEKEHNKMYEKYRYSPTDIVDWYLKNKIDIRGLIHLNLAIDATNLGIYE